MGRKNGKEICEKKCEHNKIKMIGKYVDMKTAMEFECHCGRRFFDLPKYKLTSCGCIKRRNPNQWKGFMEISGGYFYALKRGAKLRKIKFRITIEDAWHQFEQQQGKCAYTGERLYFSRLYKDAGREQTASLDRINSDRGYEAGNIQWVHKKINTMKNRLNHKDFLELCALVVKTHKIFVD